jgi:hypothetical protein
MSAQETTDTTTDNNEEIDWDQRYRNYLEKNRGNLFADMALHLLGYGLNLHVPNPVTPEVLKKYYDAGIVQKKDLVAGEYYWGKCRNASLAMWTGKHFVYLRTKFGDVFDETIRHIEDDDGADVFVPIKMLKYIDDVTS